MKLLTFSHNGMNKIGVMLPEGILDLSAAKDVPGTMLELIDGGAAALALVKHLAEKKNPAHILSVSAVTILAPIPRPRKNVFCAPVREELSMCGPTLARMRADGNVLLAGADQPASRPAACASGPGRPHGPGAHEGPPN